MSSSEYSSAKQLAKRLIQKKGRTGVRLLRPGVTKTSDVSKPWKLDGITSSDIVLATGLHVVFLDLRVSMGYLGQFGFDISFRSRIENPDSLITNATGLALFIPEELGQNVLMPGDLLESNSNRYTILRSDPLQPGDEVVMYSSHIKE